MSTVASETRPITGKRARFLQAGRIQSDHKQHHQQQQQQQANMEMLSVRAIGVVTIYGPR